MNAIASPRSNGQVERINRTIIDGLNTMSDNESTWDEKLPHVVWGIKNTHNATTTFPPFKLMFSHENSRLPAFPSRQSQDPKSQEQALQSRRNTAKLCLDKNMSVMKKRFDQSRKKCVKYSVGQLVLWKGGGNRVPSIKVSQKLKSPYTGPYKVCKAEPNTRYVVLKE